MSNLNKYLKLRVKIREMQEIAKGLEDEVRNELSEVGGTYKTKLGTLYHTNRVAWEYKPDVKQKITRLKNEITEIQEQAKNSGMADKKITISVGYLPRKEDK